MAEKLKYSPLLEALCEFRLVSQSWDWTIPGRMYDVIQETYPLRAQVESQLHIAPKGPLSRVPERVQMRRKDGGAMVQVGPNILVINHLKPYSDWPTFLPMILDAFTIYSKIAGEFKIVRVGLRYINQIKMGLMDFKIESVTTLPTTLPGALNKPLEALYQRYEYAYEEQNTAMIVQLASQRGKEDNYLMLDFDAGSAPHHVFDGIDTVKNWLNAAHDRIDEAFLSAINPEMLDKWKRGEEK